MSKSVAYQIRLDQELKEQAFAVFHRLGLTPAQAIKMFLTQAIQTQSLPIATNFSPNAVTIQAIFDAKNPEKIVRCSDAEDLFKQLGI